MTETASAENRSFENPEALAHNAAEWLCGLVLASSGAFAVSLAGGSTPRRLYELLATQEFASRIPWRRVHWFWGDERFVRHDHPDSNYGMARDAFLARVPVPKDNIHAVQTDGGSPEQAAAAYEATLKRFYGARYACSRSATLRRHAAWNRGGWTHRLIVPRSSGAARDATMGSRGHWRKIRAAHHTDLPGTRQQPRGGVPGERCGKAGRRRAHPGGRSDVTGGQASPVGHLHWFTDRAASAAGAH